MSCTQSQNFSAKIFFLIWASFKCYFWIHHLKIMSGTNFHENIIRHSNYWRKCFPMIFKDGLFQKEWGDFGPNLWHPYLGNHSGYNAQIWLFSLSLRYEPLCQISWFFLKVWVSDPYYLPCLMWNFLWSLSDELRLATRH